MEFRKHSTYVITGLATTLAISIAITFASRMNSDDQLPAEASLYKWSVVYAGKTFTVTENHNELIEKRLILKNEDSGKQYHLTIWELPPNKWQFARIASGQSVNIIRNEAGSYVQSTEIENTQYNIPRYSGIVKEPKTSWINKGNVAVPLILVFLIVVALILGLLAWLAPIYIAHQRRHRNFVPILIIDLVLGLTFVGWIVCLAWACSDNVRPAESKTQALAAGRGI